MFKKVSLLGLMIVGSTAFAGKHVLEVKSSVDTLQKEAVRLNVISTVIKDTGFSALEGQIAAILDKNSITKRVEAKTANSDLLVVASFVADRNIKTFNLQSLTDAQDIAKLGGVVVSGFSAPSQYEVRFQSELRTPFNSIYSMNRLFVVPQSEISYYSNIKNMVAGLSKQKPQYVSYQEGTNFSSFLNRSQVLTMYFELPEGRTLIKSFTLTQTRSSMNFLVRGGMKKTIQANLKAIPGICEANGARW